MKVSKFRNFSFYLLPLLALLVVLTAGLPALAASANKAQKSFATAEDAATALAVAVKSGSTKEMIAILGPGSEKIISSGDEVDDKASQERFSRLYDEKHLLDGAAGSKKTLLLLGNDDFPFPVPLVKTGEKWRFDTKAGKEELINRRIGRNELAVIDIMLAYADAQREYIATDWDGDGTREFAQKFRSTPEKKDGLYWPVKEGEKESPFGPMVAKADSEGYARSKGGDHTPYHGYLFKILKAQGANVEGGTFDYLVNGKMILGFALVAYPAEYGNSGIMTFVVNQNGIVYQKDLGKNTAKTAATMKRYNPDSSWKKVE